MKKYFTLIVLGSLFSMLVPTVLKAQVNDLYWAEGFEGGTISTLNPQTGGGPTNYWGTGVNSTGTWFLHDTYRTTGSEACVGYGTNHLRILKPLVLTDTSYFVTPVVGYGIGTLHITRVGTPRRLSVFITTDTSVDLNNALDSSANDPYVNSTSKWTRVYEILTGPSSACVDTAITINSPTATRVAIGMDQGNTSPDDDSIVLTSYATIPTPVVFRGITAALANGVVNVNWSIATGSELNVKSYVVERSSNGINYTAIGTVDAANLSNYSYTDASPLSGSAFYRIKEVDNNGSSMYSNVASVRSSSPSIVVSPNPVTGSQFNLTANNLTAGVYTLNVISNAGQKVYSSNVTVDGTPSQSIVITLPSISKGLYTIQLGSGAASYTKGIIVE